MHGETLKKKIFCNNSDRFVPLWLQRKMCSFWGFRSGVADNWKRNIPE